MRRGRAARAGAACILLATGLVAGCGGGSSSYCDALAEHSEIFAGDSGTALLANLETLRDLAGLAPDDLGDEWQVVLVALGGLDEAVRAAGLEPGDYRDGEPPAGLAEDDRRRIAAAASQVAAPEVVAAFAGIDQQARDVCKLQLGL